MPAQTIPDVVEEMYAYCKHFLQKYRGSFVYTDLEGSRPDPSQPASKINPEVRLATQNPNTVSQWANLKKSRGLETVWLWLPRPNGTRRWLFRVTERGDGSFDWEDISLSRYIAERRGRLTGSDRVSSPRQRTGS